MTSTWIAFEPLDVVVFRDGRPFSAGENASARTTFPRPTTMAGAVTAALGRRPRWLAGPLLADDEGLLFRVPNDVVARRKPPGTLRRLRVSRPEPEIVSDLGPDVRVLPGSPPALYESVDGWWSGESIRHYLDGQLTPLAYVRQPLVRERRVGLAKNALGTAEEGLLYAAEFLRPAEPGVSFACHVGVSGDGPPKLARDVVKLGGESRLAEVRVRELALPRPPDSFPEGRLLLYLATPAIFARGWLPDDTRGAEIYSALVSGPEPVSSWTLATARPTPVEWAVAAGSVYFLRFKGEQSAAAYATRWHGKCLTQKHGWARSAGFGLCLIGRWNENEEGAGS